MASSYDCTTDEFSFDVRSVVVKNHDGSSGSFESSNVGKMPLFFMNFHIGDLSWGYKPFSIRWKISPTLAISDRLAILSYLRDAHVITFSEVVSSTQRQHNVTGYALSYNLLGLHSSFL